jgi:hypothetical protein
VDRAVAERVDDAGLVEDRLAGGLLETRLVDQCRDLVVVWQAERWIVLVGPGDRNLQRAPGVEAGRARIAIDRELRPCRGVVHRPPLALKKGELAHAVGLEPTRVPPDVALSCIWAMTRAM